MDGKDGADGKVGKGIRLVITGALLTGSDTSFKSRSGEEKAEMEDQGALEDLV